jgi:hypothetical protein
MEREEKEGRKERKGLIEIHSGRQTPTQKNTPPLSVQGWVSVVGHAVLDLTVPIKRSNLALLRDLWKHYHTA